MLLLILSYGDIVYAGGILDQLLDSQADIAVAIDIEWESYWRARSDDPLADAETLRLGEDGRIVEIGRHPRSLDEIEGQYMGLMKFSGHGLEQLKAAYHKALQEDILGTRTVDKAYMTDLLQALIESGCRVQAVPVSAPWIEVDTVTDLLLDEVTRRAQAISGRLDEVD